MKIFKSKIDTWIALILLSSICVTLVVAILVLNDSFIIINIIVALILIILGVAFPLWLFVTTRYIVKGDELKIQSGPFKWIVSIPTIYDVKETKNPLSSPALSLDRLLICYESRKQIMISPKDKVEFLESIGKFDLLKIK